MISSRSIFLPQRAGLRNGHLTKSGWQKRSRGWQPAVIVALAALFWTFAATAAPALDWHYHGEALQIATPEAFGARPEPTPYSPSPVVLPQPEWPSSKCPEQGLSFRSPALATGRVKTYEEDREAVRIAGDRLDDDLARSAETPAQLEALPDVLQGLNYRIEMGFEYRF